MIGRTIQIGSCIISRKWLYNKRIVSSISRSSDFDGLHVPEAVVQVVQVVHSNALDTVHQSNALLIG